MAHKHNRRRVRPRARRNKPPHELDPFSTCDFSTSSTDLSFASFDRQPHTASQSSTLFSGATSLVAARHWQNRYTAWQNRELAQRREAARIEADQIKLFGGEPGEEDDAGLCGKMMEVFEGMEWIETENI